MAESNIEEILPKLIKISTFRQLKGNELEELAKIVDIVTYKDEEVIVKEGSVSQYLYAVIEGNVTVKVRNADNEAYITMIGQGDIFGEAGIFVKVKRTANVISAGQTSILQIERQKLFNFIKTNSSAGITILMQIIYSMLKKLREVNQELAFERKDDFRQEEIDSLIESLREEE